MCGDLLIPGVYRLTVLGTPALLPQPRHFGGKTTFAGLRKADPRIPCLLKQGRRQGHVGGAAGFGRGDVGKARHDGLPGRLCLPHARC